MRQIVEKARKRKVTALKKAIIKMREKVSIRKENKSKNQSTILGVSGLKKLHSNVDEDQLSSGYVTIEEVNDAKDGGVISKKNVR